MVFVLNYDIYSASAINRFVQVGTDTLGEPDLADPRLASANPLLINHAIRGSFAHHLGRRLPLYATYSLAVLTVHPTILVYLVYLAK
jgi:hypothetical protein